MSHPSSLIDPFAVARHPQLEPEVKRAILASWASDRSAVEGQPALRRPPGARNPVAVDDVMEALRWLDRTGDGAGGRHESPGSETRQ